MDQLSLQLECLSSYQQALSALEMGQRKLKELDVPTTRPDDYFAEMVKTDDHMRKVSCGFSDSRLSLHPISCCGKR